MGITQLLANEWIKFPNTNEKRAALKERFQKERNFKGVIGCIDCTHVAIVRPTHHEESYLNHKGFHSINVQAIASHDLEILNINARFPGSVHDNFIWRYSAVSDFMQQFYDSGDRSTWLLGDAGYGLEPWLMTPITDAAAESAEARYTQCHTSTRNCIERTFGLLKNVWRCLLSHRYGLEPWLMTPITDAAAESAENMILTKRVKLQPCKELHFNRILKHIIALER
ncbi:putative nuclease HARBI1 [Odontomachus brunneus]|uniref:putative nuclease HARBI1 n=1 Tax=Odontomachus brunneus TaxID=486640 RepID=UPI0013F27D56|nr:putative nuclease HARBI1 [Odontomachus brunneus]